MRARDFAKEERVSPRVVARHHKAGYGYCQGFAAYVRVVILDPAARSVLDTPWLQIDFSPYHNTHVVKVPTPESLYKEWEHDQQVDLVVRRSIMSHVDLDRPLTLVVDGCGQLLHPESVH